MRTISDHFRGSSFTDEAKCVIDRLANTVFKILHCFKSSVDIR